MEVKIIKQKRSSDNENYENYTREQLLAKIKSLEAHNTQLKNIISKADTEKKQYNDQKPFDFTKCHFRHVFLRIAYLGWNYHGFAVQEDNINTIEHHLFKALTKTCLIKDRESSNYHRCGRTDKGVSALAQVISIDLRSKLVKETECNVEQEIDYCTILNKVLPDNIQCVAWGPVDDNCSARFECYSRTYKYFFPQGYLDVDRMRIAGSYLEGSHDFRNFCKMDVGNGVVQFNRFIEKVEIDYITEDCDKVSEFSFYQITIAGKAFLWHQIRCIMAVLIRVGQKKEEPEVVKELLDVTKHPRKPEYSMASEVPLNLFYSDFNCVDWIYNSQSLKDVVAKFKKIWIQLGSKQVMIKAMINEMELKMSKEDILSQTCISELLLQETKFKHYIPLLKRQTCSSLEDKIEHFTKRKRIECVNKE